MTSLLRQEPASPFGTWPIQYGDPEVGFAWYLKGGIIVTQVSCDHGSVHAATIVSDWIDLLLQQHNVEIELRGGMIGIHDWRRIRKYDSAARTIWFERMRRRPKGYLRKAVVVIADIPLLKMAIAGTNLLLTVAARGDANIEVTTNIFEAMRKYEVKSPGRE